MKVLRGIFRFIIFIIILVVLYVVFRAFCIYVLLQPNGESIVHYQNKVITLQKGNTCSTSFSGFSMCIPDGFALEEDAKDGFVTYTSSDQRGIIGGEVEYSFEKFLSETDSHITKEKIHELEQKYQFKTNTDILKYLSTHQDVKFNLSSNMKEEREFQLIWNYVQTYFPAGDVYFIDGDYHGYLIQRKNEYHFYLDYNNKSYVISFINKDLNDSYFTEDVVSSLCGSIQFKD